MQSARANLSNLSSNKRFVVDQLIPQEQVEVRDIHHGTRACQIMLHIKIYLILLVILVNIISSLL